MMIPPVTWATRDTDCAVACLRHQRKPSGDLSGAPSVPGTGLAATTGCT